MFREVVSWFSWSPSVLRFRHHMESPLCEQPFWEDMFHWRLQSNHPIDYDGKQIQLQNKKKTIKSIIEDNYINILTFFFTHFELKNENPSKTIFFWPSKIWMATRNPNPHFIFYVCFDWSNTRRLLRANDIRFHNPTRFHRYFEWDEWLAHALVTSAGG